MTLERQVLEMCVTPSREQIASPLSSFYIIRLMLLERLLTSLKGQVDRVVAVDNTPGSSGRWRRS